MTPSSFDELLSLIEGDISKQWTHLRNDVISPRERLSVTMKYLASGYNYSDLQHLTRIHKIEKGHSRSMRCNLQEIKR